MTVNSTNNGKETRSSFQTNAASRSKVVCETKSTMSIKERFDYTHRRFYER